jgi:hypothetical protein
MIEKLAGKYIRHEEYQICPVFSVIAGAACTATALADFRGDNNSLLENLINDVSMYL